MKLPRKIAWSILEIISSGLSFGVTMFFLAITNFPIWGVILPIVVLVINLEPVLFVWGVIRKTIMIEESFIFGVCILGNLVNLIFCVVLVFLMNISVWPVIYWLFLLIYIHILILLEVETGLRLERKGKVG